MCTPYNFRDEIVIYRPIYSLLPFYFKEKCFVFGGLTIAISGGMVKPLDRKDNIITVVYGVVVLKGTCYHQVFR